MSKFTHFNKQGRAQMVDISGKETTERTAIARSSVFVTKEIYENIIHATAKKGDVLGVAQIAGIMGAKNTPDIIPMCHPLQLRGIDITFDWHIVEEKAVYELIIEAFVKTKGSTGVEMEALTAASVTALTIYDMCKSMEKGMTIGETYLIEKKGGKSGDYERKK